MRKLVTSVAVITVLASGVAVFQLKRAVQEKEDAVRAIAQQIHADREALRILEAEWAYLSSPRLLQDRSVQFLALMPPRAKQVLRDPVVVPFRPRGLDVDEAEANSVILPVSEKKTIQKTKKMKGSSL